MELKYEGALKLPTTNKKEIMIKIIALNKLEGEIGEFTQTYYDKLRQFQVEKRILVGNLAVVKQEVRELAFATPGFPAIKTINKIKYSYNLITLFAHPQSLQWTKKILDKVALRNYVKINGDVKGFQTIKFDEKTFNFKKLTNYLKSLKN